MAETEQGVFGRIWDTVSAPFKGNEAQAATPPQSAPAPQPATQQTAPKRAAAPAEPSAAQKARAKVEQGIVENVAIFAKENFTVLYTKAYEISGEKLQPPKDDEGYTKLARELIEKRQLTLTNESGKPVTITLDQVDANEEKQAKAAGIDIDPKTPKFSSMVPTKAQVKNASKAVADGVEENTGGLFGLFAASLGNIISGLIEWISSGFEGGFGGLFGKIGEVTAKNTVESVKNNLSAADTGLSKEQRAEMVERVKDEAEKKAGMKNDGKVPTPIKTLADVKAPNLAELSALGVTLSVAVQPATTPTVTPPSTEVKPPAATPTVTPPSTEVKPHKSKKEQKHQTEHLPSTPAIPQVVSPPALPTPSPADTRLKDTATTLTTQIMQKLDSSQTPDTKTVGLTVGVLTRFLEDNPKLLEEKNYKSIADKAIDGLLANKETGDALRNAARDKAKSEYSSASSLLEKGTKLTLVTTLQNDAMANKLIKEKLVGIVTPLLENGGVKALSEAMKPKDLKVSSLVEPSQSIKLAYAEMPKTLDQFVPSGSGQSTSAGTVRG